MHVVGGGEMRIVEIDRYRGEEKMEKGGSVTYRINTIS